MNRALPSAGEIWIHFKEKQYRIITMAEDVKTGESYVVYQALYGSYGHYLRPLDMFMSEVDHQKYPDCQRTWRFEKLPNMCSWKPEFARQTNVQHTRKKGGQRFMFEKEIIELVRSTHDMLTEEKNLEITAKGRANFVTQMDVAVQEYMRTQLQEIDRDVTLLSEEQDNSQVMDPDGRYWILDPIDGTQNFIRHFDMSAVSLAYYAQGTLQAAVVYNPFTDELFHATRGGGAFLNGKPIHVTGNGALSHCLVAIGTSPYDRQYTEKNFPLFQAMYSQCLDIRRTGSACLDLAYVAAGRTDIYFERNLKPWDMAAGILLVEEAGGRVTTYDGQVPDVLHNEHIIATNGLVHDETARIIHQYW